MFPNLTFLKRAAFVSIFAASSSALILVSESALAAPKEVKFKEIPLEFNQDERLVVTGIRARVQLIGAGTTDPATGVSRAVLRAKKVLKNSSQKENLQRFENLNFAVRREAGSVVIEAKGPESKVEWLDWTHESGPELVFEIEGASVPAEIFAHGGEVVAQKWSQPITATLVNGAVRTKDTAGMLRVQVQRGEVDIDAHRGRTELDCYGAKLKLNRIEGDLIVTNFGGESLFNEVKGHVEIRAQGGPVTVAKSSGSLEFQSGHGVVNVNGFEGPIRGRSEVAAVNAQVEGEAAIEIESNQGPVAVRLPASSGAAVKLETEEGYLNAPGNIRTNSSQKGKSASGRLSGEGPKGNVRVKTKSGTIRVR